MGILDLIHTIWRNELPVGSRQLCERQDHQDLGTMTHRWNQLGAPDPVVVMIKTCSHNKIYALCFHPSMLEAA